MPTNDLQSKIEKLQRKIEKLESCIADVDRQYAFSASARTKQKNKLKELRDELSVEKGHLQYLFDSMPIE